MKLDPRQEKLNEIRRKLQLLRDAGGLPPKVKSKGEGKTIGRQVTDRRRKKANVRVEGTVKMAVRDHQGNEEEKTRCPFSEEEYRRLVHAFQDLDVDGGGDLTMKEVMRIPEIVGRHDLVVDRNLFKKMDKDRSGTVDFLEMLRCLYPTTSVQVIKTAVSKWSLPNPTRARHNDANEDTLDWQACLSPAVRDELKAIFNIYSEEIAPGVTGITLASLRSQIPISSVGVEALNELFANYCTLPPIGEAFIPFDSFTSIMELTYTSADKGSKAPQLYFQKKDGPTYPLSLPRV